MPRNYNTTNSQPFAYFDVCGIVKDPATQVVTVTYAERMALKDADGVTRFLSEPPVLLHSFVLRPEQMTDSVPVVDLATGASTGAHIKYGQVMAGVIAAIRADQFARDAAVDAS